MEHSFLEPLSTHIFSPLHFSPIKCVIFVTINCPANLIGLQSMICGSINWRKRQCLWFSFVFVVKQHRSCIWWSLYEINALLCKQQEGKIHPVLHLSRQQNSRPIFQKETSIMILFTKDVPVYSSGHKKKQSITWNKVLCTLQLNFSNRMPRDLLEVAAVLLWPWKPAHWMSHRWLERIFPLVSLLSGYPYCSIQKITRQKNLIRIRPWTLKS